MVSRVEGEQEEMGRKGAKEGKNERQEDVKRWEERRRNDKKVSG